MIKAGFLREDEREGLRITLARDGCGEPRASRRGNAIVLPNDGGSCGEVAVALPMDDNSIRCCCKLYEEHGLAGLAVVGHGDSDSHLTPRQEAELVEWVQAFDRLLVFDGVDFDECVERDESILLGLGHPDLRLCALGLCLLALRQLVQNIRALADYVESRDRKGIAQKQRVGACQNRKRRATFLRTCSNAALYRVVVTRMRGHQPTLDDVRRRKAEGKGTPEIIRCLKRFVAREIFASICPAPNRAAPSNAT